MGGLATVTGFGLCGRNGSLTSTGLLPRELVSVKHLRTGDPFARMVATAAREALARSDLDGRDHRIGLVLSSVFGPAEASFQYLTQLMSRGPIGLSPGLFLDGISSMAAGYASIYLKTRGTIVTLAGGSPMQLAMSWLRLGRESAVLVIGAEAFSAPSRHIMQSLNLNGNPEFAPSLCDAAAAVVIETIDSAVKRNVPRLADVGSFEISRTPHDGMNIWNPDVSEAATSISPTEFVEPGRIAVVSCANGVASLSLAERELFSFPAASAIVQPKRLVGETLAASGPIGLIAGALHASAAAVDSIVIDYQVTGEISVTRLIA